MYYDAIDALQHKLIQRTSTGLLMVTDLKNGRSDGKMQHLVGGCGWECGRCVCVCVCVLVHVSVTGCGWCECKVAHY